MPICVTMAGSGERGGVAPESVALSRSSKPRWAYRGVPFPATACMGFLELPLTRHVGEAAIVGQTCAKRDGWAGALEFKEAIPRHPACRGELISGFLRTGADD